MISAAVTRSFFVFRIRPRGFWAVSSGPPRTRGITATPVSNPESPRASFGNRSIETPSIRSGLPCSANSAVRQSDSTEGCWYTSRRATASSTAFRPR